MGMTDEINELEDSLKGMDKLLVQSSKDAMMLKSSLKGVNTLVSGKNYEIISRFLSGTGAWKVLNKAKATVLTMIQLVSIQERAALQDNLRMKEMAKIIKERKELLKLEAQFKKASVNMDKESIEKLKEKSDVFSAISLEVGDEKAIAQILKRIGKSRGLLDKILGKGKVSGKTIVEDPMSKSILESTTLQTAAVVTGFMLNQKFLKQMATSSTEVSKFASEQNNKIAELTATFNKNNPELVAGRLAGVGGEGEYQDKLLAHLNKETGFALTDKNRIKGEGNQSASDKFQINMEQAKKILEDSAKLFKNITLDPRELKNQGIEYVKNLVDVNEESYKKDWEVLREREKLFKQSKIDPAKFAKKFPVADDFDNKLTRKKIDEQKSQMQFTIPAQGMIKELTSFFSESAKEQYHILEDREKNTLGLLIQTKEKIKKRLDGFILSPEDRQVNQDSRRSRRKKAFGLATTDEEKEQRGKLKNTSEKFVNRQKILKKIFGTPLLRIRQNIVKNGGIINAMKTGAAEGFTKLVEFTGKLLMFAKKAFVSIGLAILALFLLYRAFKSAGVREKLGEIWEQTKSLFTMMVLPFLELVASGIGDIVTGFQEGKFFLVIEGLLKILGGIIMASLALLSLALIVVLKLIHAGIMGIVAWATKSSDSATKTMSKIAYIASAVLFLVAFFTGGWLIALGAVFALAIGAALEKLSFLPGFSKGGVTGSGLSVVGEKGPELVKLPTGSRVYSNADSGKMVAARAASSGGNTINVHVNGRVGASDTEIRDIANKVAKEINIRMNQTSSTVSMI